MGFCAIAHLPSAFATCPHHAHVPWYALRHNCQPFAACSHPTNLPYICRPASHQRSWRKCSACCTAGTPGGRCRRYHWHLRRLPRLPLPISTCRHAVTQLACVAACAWCSKPLLADASHLALPWRLGKAPTFHPPPAVPCGAESPLARLGHLQAYRFQAAAEQLRPPRVVRIGIIQHGMVAPTTAPIEEQRQVRSLHSEACKRLGTIVPGAPACSGDTRAGRLPLPAASCHPCCLHPPCRQYMIACRSL